MVHHSLNTYHMTITKTLSLNTKQNNELLTTTTSQQQPHNNNLTTTTSQQQPHNNNLTTTTSQLFPVNSLFDELTGDVLEHKWRASLKPHYVLIKRLILTINTQATKIKSEFFNYVYTVKGIQCHSNRSPQLFELKKKQQNQVTSF